MNIGDRVNTPLGVGTIMAYNYKKRMYAVKIDSAFGQEWFYEDELEESIIMTKTGKQNDIYFV